MEEGRKEGRRRRRTEGGKMGREGKGMGGGKEEGRKMEERRRKRRKGGWKEDSRRREGGGKGVWREAEEESTWLRAACGSLICRRHEEGETVGIQQALVSSDSSAGSATLIHITCGSLFEASTARLCMGSLASPALSVPL